MAADLDFDRLVVTVRSSDGHIAATSRRRGDVKLAFNREDTFDRYRPDSLRSQLDELLERLERTRVAIIRDAMTKAGYEMTDPDEPHWDKQQREFQQAVSAIEATGFSADSIVGIASNNLVSFSTDIDADAFADLDADSFTWHFGFAYARMIADHRWQVTQLRRKHLPR